MLRKYSNIESNILCVKVHEEKVWNGGIEHRRDPI